MVKRYLIGVYGEHQHPSGDFVHWQDYQAICAELEQVERERDEALAKADVHENANRYLHGVITGDAERLAGTRVVVKPLEWDHFDNGNAYARTYFLTYCANTDGTWMFRNGVRTKVGDDLDAAKAAAQADYERRILFALAEPAGEVEPVDGWIVGNGDGTKWRTWVDGMPGWTDDRSAAIRFARREDAEAVHAEDEDAWKVEQAQVHDWFEFKGMTCCRKCGNVKNETSNQRACKGRIKIALRDTTPPASAIREADGPDDAVSELFVDAWAEAEKAMRKFPQPNYVISKVAEEAGEVVKAAIHCAEGRDTAEHVAAEIKQAIAMLIRLYIEGDQVHGLPSIRAAPAGSAE